MDRRKLFSFLFVIVVLSLGAAFFIYQPLWESVSAWRPWSLGLDIAGGSSLTYDIDMSQIGAADQDSVVRGLQAVIERRVNLFGVSEPRVYTAKEGSQNRLVVELAGIRDVKEAIKEIGATPFLDFRKVEETTAKNSTTTISFVKTKLTGRYVIGAQVVSDPYTREPVVSLEFNSEGAKIFEGITSELEALSKTNPDPACYDPRQTGNPNGRRLAIFLDDQLIEVPCVHETIPGGKPIITGNFTRDTAQQLVERFNAGALPAPITLVSQKTTDADFGKDSLDKAIFAGAIGTLIVLIFMIIYYRKFGVFAALALIMYIALTLAVFKIVPVTLTLAGIAGFILSIGMAVDANILVFERTKEELRKGFSHETALEEGFKRAWTSIRDSNVSTMITAAVLYYFTSNFVKGFALALFLGVVMSMFSAITITRTLLRVFLKKS